MKKICSYPGCNAVVEVDDFDRSSPRCPLHAQDARTPKKRYAHHYHDGKNIYYTYQWKKLRKAYIGENPLCEMCAKRGINTPARVVDHIKEISDGGEPFDWDNLQSLCNECHYRKTLDERRKRNAEQKGFSSLSDF